MGQSLNYEPEIYHKKLQLFSVLICRVHSLIHHLLSAYDMSGTVLNARDTAANKAQKNLCYYEVYAKRSGETDNEQNK